MLDCLPVHRLGLENPSNINKCSNARLSSDPIKLTVVNESLSKNNLEMFCSREKSTELIANQQNEKSTQIYSKQLWIRGPVITAFMGKKCYQG